MDTLIDILFYTAGAALFGHLVLCVVLKRRLGDQPDLLRNLFVAPNAVLLGDHGVWLLRVRYYWPWAKFAASNTLDEQSRMVLYATQATGLILPIAALGFLATQILRVVY